MPGSFTPGIGKFAMWTHFMVLDTKLPDRVGPQRLQTMLNVKAKYRIGQVVKHRVYPFRGVIFDVDPIFANTEQWWESIPEEVRPRKDQPFYHLFAENETTYYVAYVSEQNLVPDNTGEPVDHPEVGEFFGEFDGGQYTIDSDQCH